MISGGVAHDRVYHPIGSSLQPSLRRAVVAQKPLVVLSRRQELYKEVASWKLPGVDLYLHESPSEALAQLADGQAVLFLFDTAGYTRYRHVIRKFFSQGVDADLFVLGELDVLAGVEEDRSVAVRHLPSDAPFPEIRNVIERLLQLREVRLKSGIVGRSRAVSQMISLIAHAAPLDVNILIQGESGTGKELVARAVHDHSSRKDGPFLSLNCGAMSEGVLESELFGHARGAFTGAVTSHDGVFKRANRGSLFLDEVAEMPLGMQTRFLRALETGEFTPVGGSEILRSDIRLIAATHRELAREVEEGRFRQDLYYRLHVVVITTPPLRDRKEDIPVLTQLFLAQENKKHRLSVRGIAKPTLQLMENYLWPGNVRELRNVLSAMVVLKQVGMIEAEDLPPEIRYGKSLEPGNLPVPIARDPDAFERELVTTTILEMREDIKEIKAMLQGRLVGSRPALEPFGGDVVETYPGDSGYSPVTANEGGDLQTAEKALIAAALEATQGNRRQAANRLGISERTLYRKIKRFGL
jgi:DNA-binding NtrC family response regulator